MCSEDKDDDSSFGTDSGEESSEINEMDRVSEDEID
jgi:hypothetical protein